MTYLAAPPTRSVAEVESNMEVVELREDVADLIRRLTRERDEAWQKQAKICRDLEAALSLELKGSLTTHQVNLLRALVRGDFK